MSMTPRRQGEPPLVSVLMPCFNSELYLHQALDSICSQSLDNLEVVAVDDNSSDMTPSILRRYANTDSRIRVFTLPSTRGVTAALNAGRDFCRGKFIARMDSDDVAQHERLELQVGFLEQNPKFAGVGSWIQIISDGGRLGSVKQYPVWSQIRSGPYATGGIGPSPFAHPTMLLRKEALDSVGWYRRAFQHAQDADLWRRMLDAGFFLTNIERVLLKYRIHSHNISTTALGAQATGSLQAALSQRMRIAGLADPFDKDYVAKPGAVVVDWNDFPKSVRGPVRGVWVRKNMSRLLGEAPELLADELIGAVADGGWHRKYAPIIWSAARANLHRGQWHRALVCTVLGLRHAKMQALRSALRACITPFASRLGIRQSSSLQRETRVIHPRAGRSR